MKCFYHNDMDGKCAAAIVRRKFPEMAKADFIEMDYDKPFPFDVVAEDEDVVIVDFSLQKDGDFDKLVELTEGVIWIDHHKSAIEKHSGKVGCLPGVRDTSKAGCVLTWEYFYAGDEDTMAQPVPKIVELLGDYDIWAFKHGDDTRNLQAGVKLEETHPCNTQWELWFYAESSVHKMIDNGKLIRRFLQRGWKERINQIGFYAEFNGYRVICCNSPKCGSMLFDSVDHETYDFMMPFYCSDRGWTISLYNTKGIDGTEIAKKYGGGGHPGACGFQCKQLYFKDGKIEVVTEQERRG